MVESGEHCKPPTVPQGRERRVRYFMRYLAQREHVLTSLNALLSYLYCLSYLSFPSFFLLATRWVIQYAWLALHKEVAKHQLRWGLIPLVLLVVSLWIHCATTPGASVILDFIGHHPRQHLSVVLFLDLAIAFLELLVAAIFYEQVISYANILTGRKPRISTFKGGKSRMTTRETKLVIDMPCSLFVKLLFNPKALLPVTTRPRVPTTQDAEDGAIMGTGAGSRSNGLPLPFNLESTASNRAVTPEHPVPGGLLRDW